MSQPASLYQYAQAYRKLANEHASPELKALLVRMAEVWESLASHSSRIAAERAAAEQMPDQPQDGGETRVHSPGLSPLHPGVIDQHEHTD